MRLIAVFVLIALALWRAAIDWRATIGEGYAYRLTSISEAALETWPEQAAEKLASWEARNLPIVWDPLGSTLIGMPLALVPAILAFIVWVSRPRSRSR